MGIGRLAGTILAAGLAGALLLAGCGNGDDGGAATTAGPSSTAADGTGTSNGTSTGATTTDGGSPTTPPAVATTGPGGTAPATSTGSPLTLPGEPFDGFAAAGEVMMVVGVAHDDTLNLRSGPGTGYGVVTRLDPLDEHVVATGRARLLEQSVWYEVTSGGVTGWASSSYLAFGGQVDDVTSQVVAALGETPQAETMVDLAAIVTAELSSEEVTSRVTLVAGPTVGDLGEIAYDVIGVADDSVYGVRLHIFGQPTGGGEGFSLKSVEQMTLCGRGVDEIRRCV
jgi:hypothetical protein